MPDDLEQLSANVSLETARLRAELSELNGLSSSFGATLSRAFASAIVDGRKLTEVLKGLALSLSRQALTAALKPLTGLFDGLSAGPKPTPFAAGGVVNSPHLFALRGGTGLMGEAGPEAILPLARGADGKLGVRGGGGRAVQVTVNVSTPDAASFQRSRGQIAASLLRAIERGQRNL